VGELQGRALKPPEPIDESLLGTRSLGHMAGQGRDGAANHADRDRMAPPGDGAVPRLAKAACWWDGKRLAQRWEANRRFSVGNALQTSVQSQ
jgi:hypothetical protein